MYVPLVKALDEIGWEVRVKGAVADALAKSTAPIVQSHSQVEHRAVEVSVVIVGKPADARALKEQLDRDLLAATGVSPDVEVYAVADASAVAGIESTLAAPHVIPAEPPPPPPSVGEQLSTARSEIRSSTEAMWPVESAGKPLAIGFDTASDGSFAFRIRHIGAPLGADATEMLRKALALQLKHPSTIVDVPIDGVPLTPMPIGRSAPRFLAR